MLMRKLATFEAPPLFQPDFGETMASPRGHSTHGSIETLVVVLAVITIAGVLAGIFARVCGGRHLAGNAEHDFEGWVERKCRSCIDGGVQAGPLPDDSKAGMVEAAPPAAAEESKK